jgi:protocatechuate 3,4-dioxygenase beta subunit
MGIPQVLLFSRRSFLLAGVSALAWSETKTPICTLTPEQEQGPFYIDERFIRRDITEKKVGVPLALRIAVMNARSCAPLSGAAVDIWHCDALGIYSGFDAGGRGGFAPGPPPKETAPPSGPSGPMEDHGPPPPARMRRGLNSGRYLRGVQLTTDSGRADFLTVYPGWYVGRAVHIHVKVHVASGSEQASDRRERVCHTGQLFFPEEITADIVKLSPYVTRSTVRRTRQEEDGVFTQQHGGRSLLALTALDRRAGSAGFLGEVTLAVDPEATPAGVRPWGQGAPPPFAQF